MSRMAEHDWETRLLEQSDMEADPAYQEWLDNYDKGFAMETQAWYNNGIEHSQEKH